MEEKVVGSYTYSMKNALAILIAILLVMVGLFVLLNLPQNTNPTQNDITSNQTSTITLDPVIAEHIASKSNLIVLNTPKPNELISSPLIITGKARGYWFFEANFPLVLVDWDGRIIAEYYATAQGDWMTEDFVPFSAVFEFQKADTSVSDRGALILRRDNPSDLPQNNDALEIPVRFQ